MVVSMRRKKTHSKPFQPYETKRDIRPALLNNVGAITLTWNYIEHGINFILGMSLKLPPPIGEEVTSRINGLDGKIEILKRAAKLLWKMPDHYLKIIGDTLGAIEEHKRYRDGIIHAGVFHPESPVADTLQRRGVTDEVLVTDEALNALYERLTYLQAEIDVLTYVYFCCFLWGEKEYGRKKRLIAKEMEACTVQLCILQKRRKALPPLPKFPAELPALQGREGSEFLQALSRSRRRQQNA